jgi:hypothetical protein
MAVADQGVPAARQAVRWEAVGVALAAWGLGWIASLAGIAAARFWPEAGTTYRSQAWPWGWDGGWYAGLAAEGWSLTPDGDIPQGAAFLPAWPLLLRLSMAIGLPGEFVGLALPGVCQLAWLALLHHMVRRQYPFRHALLATLVAALWPHGMTGRVAYTEPLFLACGTLVLSWGARPGKPGAVAVLAATLTGGVRVAGLALAGAGLEAQGWRRWLLLGAPAAGLAMVMAWQAWALGDPLAFLHAQHHWHDGRPPGGWGWLGPLSLGLLGPIGHQGVLKAAMAYGTVALVLRHVARHPGVAAAAAGHLALVLASGWTESGDRYLYGSPAAWWLLMPLLASHPRVAIALAIVSAVVTAIWSRAWTLGLWVF